MKNISTIYDNINIKEFSVQVLIDYPIILSSINEIDRVMKQFGDKLKGHQRVMFEDNCLERIDDLLQEEKGNFMTDPYSGINGFINFMIQSPDMQSHDNTPLSMDTCATFMSHMYDIRYSKEMWETTIYPLYVERFNLVRKPKI